MRSKPLLSALTLWSSAYLGCTVLLLLGVEAPSFLSLALLAQLSWLALLGSIPTSVALASASRIARARPTVVKASVLGAFSLGALLGWAHTDFLLSGPRFAVHSTGLLAPIATASTIGLIAVAGWMWMILGARTRAARWRVTWTAFTFIGVLFLTSVIIRHRAYDYSVAQLVLPGAFLSAATLPLWSRDSRLRPLVVGAAFACLIFGLGSRFDSELVATGQREMIAHTRTGSLAMLYVLPRVRDEAAWSTTEDPCAEPRPLIDPASIGIDPDRRRNVIIITVDALRKDVVGTTANGRPVTPELARLAETGVSFANTTSTYPATLLAIGSAFTGLSPAELYLSPALPDTIFTRTRAQLDRQLVVLPDVSWFRLPIIGQFLAPDIDTEFARNDAEATDLLISRLRAAREDDASAMAWIHYYAPHDPYQAHRAFPFGAGKKNAYLSEVALFDQQLGRLMQYLADDGWLDDSLVVFFSDHGEALGEKSYWGHHVYLNDWMVDVPLVLWHSQLPPSSPEVGVSLADVAPTVLQFLGLPIPSDISAQSLFTLDPNLPDRATFAEAFPVRGQQLFDSFRLSELDDTSIRARLRNIRRASKGYEPKGAIVQGRYRLIHHRGADTTLLYDRDARTSEPVSDSAAHQRLRAELERWEREQLQRIRCRLQLTELRPQTPLPE